MRRILPVLVATVVAMGLGAAAGPPPGALPARILRWHDGDTVEVRFTGEIPPGVGTRETVRVLGINAPEVGEPYAEEAVRHFRTLTMGKPVYVELSPWERRDSHSRLLAHLWVEAEEGWVLVSATLLRAGLARLLVYNPTRELHYCALLRALALAQRDKLGLWGKFPKELSLADLEADPVRYVTEAVTVVFAVARVTSDGPNLSLWAQGSRYGFRAIVDRATCPQAWAGVELSPGELVGQRVVVTGELQWDSFRGGPRIVVRFPEQLAVKEGG
jgi:endonuclease YncB( thermonuclease family)